MHITIAGGTGFVGRFMIHRYLAAGHTITVIGRSTDKIKAIFNDQVQPLDWETLNNTGKSALAHTDLLINLAGASIAEKRWSEARKTEIIESRTFTTQALANLCAELGDDSPPLFNASAVGIYGLQTPEKKGLPPGFDESTVLKDTPDFAAHVVKRWEGATQPAKNKNVRVVNLRFGVVLGNGGAVNRLKLPFQFGMGGKIASGQQPFSWVSILDICRAIDFLYQHSDIKGPINVVSPHCVTQDQFAKQLAKLLHRPALMTLPGFVLKLAYGDMANELLINGQHVIPTVLSEHGFTFEYADLGAALRFALGF